MIGLARAAALVAATALAVAGLGAGGGCGGSIPATQYYELALPARAAGANQPAPTGSPGSQVVLVVEPFEAAGIYDDDRIVYRTSTYRLDQYVYKRWSASPGRLASEFISRALAQTGRFRAVTGHMTPDATAVLRGRILSMEEIDRSPRRWVGHIALELQLEDARTGVLLWSGRFDRRRRLTRRDPDGLAQALSVLLSDIVAEITPIVARAAEKAAQEAAGSEG